MAGSVFGLGSSLNATLTTYCLVGIVIFTIAFESLTHHAEHKLKGTPYMEMLAKVYKEMMIMGFISFGIFMAVQAGGVGHGETLVSFEFAHIVIFFAALIFVLTALVFIFVTYRLKILYDRSASTTADHLLTEYAMARNSPWFHKMHWWGGSSKLRDMMEFKMVHLHFQMVYDLPNDFNFASYMQECLDHYIMDLIEVHPSTWLFFLVLALLNLGVNKFVEFITYDSNDADYDSSHYSSDESSHHSSTYHAYSSYSSGSGCDHSTSTSHSHRWLGGGSSATSSYSSDYYSEGDNGLFAFILGGWFLVVWVVILYVAARHSELKLLLKAGAHSTHHYEDVLIQVEEELEAREREREMEGHKLLSLQELQSKITQLKGELEHQEEDGLKRPQTSAGAPPANGGLALQQGKGKLSGRLAKLAPARRTPSKKGRGANVLPGLGSAGNLLETKDAVTGETQYSPFSSGDVADGAGDDIEGGARQWSARLSDAVQRVRVKAIGAKAGHQAPLSPARHHHRSSLLVHTDAYYQNEALTKLVTASNPNSPKRAARRATLKRGLTLKSDISDVYPFGSRRFFQKAIETFLLLACMYGALYFANYCIVAQKAGIAPAVVHLLMLAPAFIFVPVMGKVVKTSSLLQAVAEIKPGIIAKVIEETIDTQKLAASVTEKIKVEIARLGGDPSTSKDILVFFHEYATLKPGHGEMGPTEFRYALHRMFVHLSDERFLRLFKVYDLNKDGTLTAHEAAQVLWPAEAAAEAKRAKQMRGKVAHSSRSPKPQARSGGKASPPAPSSARLSSGPKPVPVKVAVSPTLPPAISPAIVVAPAPVSKVNSFKMPHV